MDDVLAQYSKIAGGAKFQDLSDLRGDTASEINSRLMSAIRRFAPNGSAHLDGAQALVNKQGMGNVFLIRSLAGILKGLREDYAAGYLATLEELIHADLFSDFLEMAEHLLAQKYKDPSAVMIGSVLEEHLRKLCVKSGIAVMIGAKPKKADQLNADLASASAYSKLDQKSITAWLDLRNKAAHGHYTEYLAEQVQFMLVGVRHFMSMHPA